MSGVLCPKFEVLYLGFKWNSTGESNSGEVAILIITWKPSRLAPQKVRTFVLVQIMVPNYDLPEFAICQLKVLKMSFNLTNVDVQQSGTRILISTRLPRKHTLRNLVR